MSYRTLIAAAFVLLGASIGFAKGNEDLTQLKPESIHIATFKNGIGVVTLQTELPKPEGLYQFRPLPDATLGSFWVSWPEQLRLTDIKATQAASTATVRAANLHEVLEANIGRTLDLKIDDAWNRLKIVDIPENHGNPVIQPRRENIIPPPTPPGLGDLILVEDSMGVRAVPIHKVQEARLDSDDPHYTIHRPKMENVIEFRSEPINGSRRNGGGSAVSFTYLAKGISWSPSYVIDISEEDEASMSAKAVIVNDLIPLENASAELITGYPHIQFENTNSAFSLTPLDQILNQLRGQPRERMADVASNVMFQSVRAAKAMEMPSMPATPVSGESTEDLYFYELDKITLKKGERGYYPLFAGKIPYEHLYTWDIPNDVDPEGRSHRGRNQDSEEIVWHSLKLTNTTGRPWTTAPAVTMKNGRILGQDTLHFTPHRGTSDLRITRAVSVQAEQTENEVDRQRNAATFYRRSYDLVVLQGELAVTNYKDKPIQLEITKTISGEVQEVEGDFDITKLAQGLQSVNPQSQIKWNVEVKPGKENAVKLTYKYQFYFGS